MSRFSNLELGSNAEGNFQQKPVVKDDVYHLGEAQAAFENGEFEQALRAYAKVLEFNPHNASAWVGQVRMLVELGEFHEAKLWADKALERLPHEPELLAAKAVALGRTGDLQAALAYSDAAIEEQGGTPYVWLARGDVLLARSEKRADFCFEKALGFFPSNWLFHWLASRIHFFYQKFSVALKLAQQALELNAGQSAVWLQLGRCQMALGLAVPARNSFEQARQLRPDSLAAEHALREQAEQGWWARWRGWWRQVLSR
jgi:tetratricopeptide (TPR) repeat protein